MPALPQNMTTEFLLSVLICSMVVPMFNCSDDGKENKDVTETRQTVEMISRLSCLVHRIIDLETRLDGTEAPTTMEGLVRWLHPAIESRGICSLLDDSSGTLTDLWGRPLQLIVVDGRLAEVGSKGPNGEWEEGKGDDIVMPIPGG